jgi:hypothetical protein
MRKPRSTEALTAGSLVLSRKRDLHVLLVSNVNWERGISQFANFINGLQAHLLVLLVLRANRRRKKSRCVA